MILFPAKLLCKLVLRIAINSYLSKVASSFIACFIVGLIALKITEKERNRERIIKNPVPTKFSDLSEL